MDVSVPIRRMEPGFYLFGTRKIYAKVLNNKLVVRVGGGYMSFQEFIDTNAVIEQKRVNDLIASGDWDIDAFAKNAAGGSPQSKYKHYDTFRETNYARKSVSISKQTYEQDEPTGCCSKQ